MLASGSGSTSPTGGIHNCTEGTVVDISATPDKGWQFVNWSGGVADPDSATTIVTLDAYKNLVANFYKSGLNWWLIAGIAAGVLIIFVTIWLVVRARAS